VERKQWKEGGKEQNRKEKEGTPAIENHSHYHATLVRDGAKKRLQLVKGTENGHCLFKMFGEERETKR